MSKKIVRAIAEYAGDADDPPDPSCRLVFQGILEDDRLIRGEHFGKYVDQIGKYPFILQPPQGGSEGALDYGWEEKSEATNVFEKEVKSGSVFTVKDEDGGEWIYRFTSVVEIA